MYLCVLYSGVCVCMEVRGGVLFSLSYFSESRRLTGPGVRLAVSLLSLLGLRSLCSNAQLFLMCVLISELGLHACEHVSMKH